MTVTLYLSPESEKLLRQKAAQEGLALEAYLGQLVELHAQAVNGAANKVSAGQVLAADFDRLLDQLCEGLPPLSTLPTDWSRAHLYADHN